MPNWFYYFNIVTKQIAARAIALCALGLLAVAPGWAHGRIGTTVSVDVSPRGAEVVVRAALLDLIHSAGGSTEDYPESRLAVIGASDALFSCIRILDSERHALAPQSAWVELPDFDSEAVRNLGLEQQAVALHLHYAFARPPAELVVWPSLGRDHHGREILADLSFNVEGELAVLPAKVGDALPFLWTFDWSEGALAPIAERGDFNAAAVSTAHRLAVTRLEIDGGSARWTLTAPLSYFRGAQEAILFEGNLRGRGDLERRVCDELAPRFAIEIDGQAARVRSARALVFSGAGTPLSNDDPVLKGQGDCMASVQVIYKAARATRVEADASRLIEGEAAVLAEIAFGEAKAGATLLRKDDARLTWQAD